MTYFSAVVTHNILYRFGGDEMMEAVVQRHRTTLSIKNPKLFAVILGCIPLNFVKGFFIISSTETTELQTYFLRKLTKWL